MKNRLFSILAVFLIASLVISPVSAGAAIKLSKDVSWSLGSLIADGYVYALGNTDVTVVLDAWGTPEVTCTNQGGNEAPGQNPSRIGATGFQVILGGDPTTKNGKSPFDVEAKEPAMVTGTQGGCPNDNWTGVVTFVYWDTARISVYQGATTDPNNFGPLLLQQYYTCTTTRNPDSVSCTAVP